MVAVHITFFPLVWGSRPEAGLLSLWGGRQHTTKNRAWPYRISIKKVELHTGYQNNLWSKATDKKVFISIERTF
jgi:hypothetical protein